MNKDIIRAKAILGLPLTKRERAYYLLFIATDFEVNAFLKRERKWTTMIQTVRAVTDCK